MTQNKGDQGRSEPQRIAEEALKLFREEQERVLRDAMLLEEERRRRGYESVISSLRDTDKETVATQGWRRFIVMLLSIVVLIGVSVGLAVLLKEREREGDRERALELAEIAARVDTFGIDVRAVETQIVGVQGAYLATMAALDSLRSAPLESRQILQVQGLRSELWGTDQRVTKLEDALHETPEKALAIPLLRRDIEYLITARQEDLRINSERIDRIYDLGAIVFGAMATLAAALVGVLTGAGARRTLQVKEPKKEP